MIVSHYHADHIYGLQAFKAAGAEIWAHRKAQQYLTSEQAADRLAQRRAELFPWVDEKTVVVPPDVWIDGDTSFRMGGLTFQLVYSEGAHSPEDLMMFVEPDRLLFAGDLIFAGRVPFVGNADSAGWLKAMDKMIALKPAVVVPGHGPASRDVERDLVLTRDYLAYLREPHGRGGEGSRAVRRRLRENRLVALQGPARVRAGEPHQCVRHVPADGAGDPQGAEAMSVAGPPQDANCTARRISTGSPCAVQSCRPPSMLADAPFGAWASPRSHGRPRGQRSGVSRKRGGP